MKPNFKKLKGLIPAIVQDFKTKKVLEGLLKFKREVKGIGNFR